MPFHSVRGECTHRAKVKTFLRRNRTIKSAKNKKRNSTTHKEPANRKERNSRCDWLRLNVVCVVVCKNITVTVELPPKMVKMVTDEPKNVNGRPVFSARTTIQVRMVLLVFFGQFSSAEKLNYFRWHRTDREWAASERSSQRARIYTRNG